MNALEPQSTGVLRPPLAAILAIDGVSKRFGGIHALEDVSFHVRVNSVTAVIGPNGAGKTTMFNIVTGVSRATSGKVVYNSHDITRWPPRRITALGMARTFQNLQLFPSLNVLENVMVARYCRLRSGPFDVLLALPRDRSDRREMREVASEWLDWIGLYDKRLRMPTELPYGDQRRLEIARALATDPRLLLLDEPTAGMVDAEAREVVELVRRLTEMKKTVVLIEHNMNVVMSVADRVVVLNFGHKIADGGPNEIRLDPRVIQAYLGPSE